MAELSVTAWGVDPAYSLIGPTTMPEPAGWNAEEIPGGSPAGNSLYKLSGEPVSLDSYLHEAVLVDRNGDQLLGAGGGDVFRIDGTDYAITQIYRGDFIEVNGTTYQVITLYGASEAGYAAIAMPIGADGRLMNAFPGQSSHTAWSLDSEPYPIPIDELPCFTAGTRIATPDGPVAVEQLRPGDLVLTLEGAALPLLWAPSRRISRFRSPLGEDDAPIRIPAGCLGAERDLWLSPLHRVLCLDRAGQQVLVPVRHLRGLGGIGEAGAPDRGSPGWKAAAGAAPNFSAAALTSAAWTTSEKAASDLAAAEAPSSAVAASTPASRRLPAAGLIAPEPCAADRPDELHYIHLILERHAILLAEGVACESFYAGPRAIAMLTPKDRRGLSVRLGRRALFPAAPARPLLDRLGLVRGRLDPALPPPLTSAAQGRKSVLEPSV